MIMSCTENSAGKSTKDPEVLAIKKRQRKLIGSLILACRKKKGWTQIKLARRLHLKSTGHISRVEQGQIGLGSHLYPLAEKELDLPPGYFMSLERDFTNEELNLISKFMDMMINPERHPQAEAIKSILKDAPVLSPDKK